MKIAFKEVKKINLSGTALALLLTLCGTHMALAAEGETMPPAAVVADASTSAAAPSAPAAAPAALPLPPSSSLPMSPEANAKALSAAEDKVKDSAKDFVKQMNSMSSINLEDLNVARLTVVKLEALIEIEKRLADLDKIHNQGKEKSLASAIPASALAAPIQLSSAGTRNSAASMGFPPMMSPPHRSEVSMISGADGHYVATIGEKSYRVGDTLPSGAVITEITAKQVTAKSKHGAEHLKVKGVDEVFGHAL